MHKPILEVDLDCPKCGKVFDNKHRRAGHIGKCNGLQTEKQKEKDTSTTTKKPESQKEKDTSTPTQNPEPVRRTTRLASSKQLEEVEEMVDSASMLTKRFLCTKCEKTYSTNNRLTKHMTSTHGDR